MTDTTTDTAHGATAAGPGTGDAPRRSWRTIDLMVAITIGVVLGVAFRGLALLYLPLDPVFAAFKPAQGILAGLWFLPAILAAIIVRKPGAALVAEMIAATVEALLGGHWGYTTLVSGLAQGIGAEIGFALFAYRRFGIVPVMVAGIAAAGLEWLYEILYSYGEWSAAWKGIYLLIMAASGAVLSAVICMPLARALAATGVLSSFRIGRESAERSRA